MRLPSRLPISARRLVLTAHAMLIGLAVVPATAGAQATGTAPGGQLAASDAPRARSAAWRADSMAVAGDSVGALALLDSAVRANRRDAESWHRRGLIAWAMARSHRTGGFIKDGTAIRRLTLADSSLRIAHRLAPDTARYATDLGRFYLNSSLFTLRFQAAGVFEQAVEAAERGGDPTQLADAADELGMIHWRRYEAVAHRRLTTGSASSPPPEVLDALSKDLPSRSQDYLDQFTVERAGNDWSGRGDYEKALVLFERALGAFGEHPRAWRHRFMALAERERWEELEQLAANRARTAPWDAWAHLAHGLAAHRRDRPAVAQAAFDSALVVLEDRERARLTSLARILRSGVKPKGRLTDSASFARAGDAERAQLDSLYWQVADPMSLTPQNEHRLEFLARVAFAELRWTADDLDRRGADTDRGEAWIRYGPPTVRAGFAATGTGGQPYEYWRYAGGLAFVFLTPPTWGTARYSPDSWTLAQEAKATQPVRWDNVPIGARIDSMEVQVARFRGAGGGDSADVFLVAEVPVGRLARGVELTPAAVDVGVGIWTGPSIVLLRDSTRYMATPADTATPVQLRAWRERLPYGDHVYRVEALQPDALRGARALGTMRLRADTGFGASDLLVAARALPRSDAVPTRWRDLNVAPSAGRFARGAPIGMVWETYGLRASAEGGTRYRVTLTLERKFESKAGAFMANVVSGVGSVAGIRVQERKGKVTLRYDRSGPAMAVALDYLTLDVNGAAPGRYQLTVAVTDLVAARTVTRTRLVRIE